MIITILIIAVCIILDQLTKYLVVEHLEPIGEKVIIENIFRFRYVENKGAAFGMLADHRWVFMVLSVVLIIAVIVWLAYNRKVSIWMRIPAALIVGGGIGNMIDRVVRGYVVDFIDVYGIKFYVFNVADSCVTVGCFLLFIVVLIDELRESKAKKAAAASVEAAKADEPSDDNGGTDVG